MGSRITIDVDRMVHWDKTLREGAIDHPDYRVGGWNWRELVGLNLFDNDLPVGKFSAEDQERLLYAEAIPVEKEHGAGTYTKNFEGIVHKLERLHLAKGEEALSAERRNAYNRYFVHADCTDCRGTRINERARSVTVNGRSLDECVLMELTELDSFLSTVTEEFSEPIIRKVRTQLSRLIEIGVGYLSLNRTVGSLSGGESQRVKMARQLDCDLVDMMYILDEPSIGLHPRDTRKLIDMLYQIRDRGNSVFVVEHDPDIIRASEWIVDIGPGAGVHGGGVVYSGPVSEMPLETSVTGRYLARVPETACRRKKPCGYFRIDNASVHNLKNVAVSIPRGVLTCVTGVAGSGKSSLIHDVFVKQYPGAVVVDQSPAGRSPRSNPATYTGMFDAIRKEFAAATGSDPGLFSFNSTGACPECRGNGFVTVEMSFLDDITVVCSGCGGRRYRDEVLKLTYRGKSIFDVLEMSVREGREFFSGRKIQKQLTVLDEVGLSYLKIGQGLNTLSGGEAQRIKLASELSKTGNVYVMDEPTTGLHMADIEKLKEIIARLVVRDNTVIVIEHNLDIIQTADWIIDMGPEGGLRGGEVVFEGTPEEIVLCNESHTGRFLREFYG